MCGVAGVYGVSKSMTVILGLLDALQYRGGQGSGIAFIRDDGAHFCRREPDEVA